MFLIFFSSIKLQTGRHFLRPPRCDGSGAVALARRQTAEGSCSTWDFCYHQLIMKVFKLIEGLTQIEAPDSDTAPRSRLIGGERAIGSGAALRTAAVG